jgi:hypothetical protein
MHEVVDEVGGGEAGQSKDGHVLSHGGPVVKCALKTHKNAPKNTVN